jgi:hypothetical protein
MLRPSSVTGNQVLASRRKQTDHDLCRQRFYRQSFERECEQNCCRCYHLSIPHVAHVDQSDKRHGLCQTRWHLRDLRRLHRCDLNEAHQPFHRRSIVEFAAWKHEKRLGHRFQSTSRRQLTAAHDWAGCGVDTRKRRRFLTYEYTWLFFLATRSHP